MIHDVTKPNQRPQHVFTHHNNFQYLTFDESLRPPSNIAFSQRSFLFKISSVIRYKCSDNDFHSVCLSYAPLILLDSNTPLPNFQRQGSTFSSSNSALVAKIVTTFFTHTSIPLVDMLKMSVTRHSRLKGRTRLTYGTLARTLGTSAAVPYHNLVWFGLWCISCEW